MPTRPERLSHAIMDAAPINEMGAASLFTGGRAGVTRESNRFWQRFMTASCGAKTGGRELRV